MLYVRPIMNYFVDQVLSGKVCNVIKTFDQNLEIHIRNLGETSVTVPSHFDLVGDFGTRRIEDVAPEGEHNLQPGRIMTFYCYMKEDIWRRATELIIYDNQGNRWPAAIRHENN